MERWDSGGAKFDESKALFKNECRISDSQPQSRRRETQRYPNPFLNLPLHDWPFAPWQGYILHAFGQFTGGNPRNHSTTHTVFPSLCTRTSPSFAQ